MLTRVSRFGVQPCAVPLRRRVAACARDTEVAYSTVLAAVNGRSRPPVEVLICVAERFLHIPVEEAFTEAMLGEWYRGPRAGGAR